MSKDPISWLVGEYSRRRRINPAYSKRAFARDIRVGPGRLSEWMLRQRQISPASIARIIRILAKNSKERNLWSEALLNEHKEAHFQELSEDHFSLIADWHHYAILSLMRTKSFKSDPKWIASRLGITNADALEAILRLKRLGLVEGTRELKRTSEKVTTSDGIRSAALRIAHAQTLRKAIESLNDVPLDKRSITSTTFPINPKNFDAAKKRIYKFRRDMESLLEVGDKTEVYELSVALIPLTKIQESINE